MRKGKKPKKSKPKKKKRQKSLMVTKEEFLRLKPVMSPFVEQKSRTDDSLNLKLDISGYKKRSIVRRFLPTPNFKRVQLDKLGMDVFLLCNGKNKVKDIMNDFQNRYKLTPTETDVAVQKFLISLTDRHLIGFIIPKEIAEKKQVFSDTIERVILDPS